MSELSTHLQTVRKLKPFIDALDALTKMGELLQSMEGQVASAEARLAKANAERDAALADADSARAFATATAAKAKEDAEAAKVSADRLIAEAKDQAETIVLDAGSKASTVLAEASDLVTKREAEIKRLDVIVAAKNADAAALEKRVADARATLRKLAEGVG